MVGKWLSLQVQEHACLLQDDTTFKRALCSVFNYSLACETPAFFMEMNETGDSYLFESPTRNALLANALSCHLWTKLESQILYKDGER